MIDDHSTDRTAAIATEAGFTVMEPPPLAEGWCGKTWALHHGVRASQGEILVFLDADTEPHPEFLERLVATQQHLGGLVSVQPFHRTEKPYEQLSLLFNLVGLMAVPMGNAAAWPSGLPWPPAGSITTGSEAMRPSPARWWRTGSWATCMSGPLCR